MVGGSLILLSPRLASPQRLSTHGLADDCRVPDNFKSRSTLLNTIPPKLSTTADGYTLAVTPPAAKPIVYEGKAARPSRRSEHVLLFDPVTKVFTLERLSTAFVFNASVFNAAHPPLPMDEGSDAEGADEEEDSPFDYRKFMGQTSAADEKKAKEEKRNQALLKTGRFNQQEPEEPTQEDENEMVIPGPGMDSDAEGETDDEEDHFLPPPPPPPAPPERKRSPIRRLAPRKPPPPPSSDDEELVFPEPVAPAPVHHVEEEESDVSDVDESDDDDAPAPSHSRHPPPPPRQAAAPPPPAAPAPAAEDDADDFDLEAALEQALDTPGGGDDDMDDAPGELVIDDDEDGGGACPAANGASAGNGGPMSLRATFGGGMQDEESDESEEE